MVSAYSLEVAFISQCLKVAPNNDIFMALHNFFFLTISTTSPFFLFFNFFFLFFFLFVLKITFIGFVLDSLLFCFFTKCVFISNYIKPCLTWKRV